MAELVFDCVGARVDRFAVVPSFELDLRISETSGEKVDAIALRAQIRIEPFRRPYSDAEAERLASSMDLNRLRRDRGQYLPLPSVEEALAYPYTDSERAALVRNRSRLFVGSPATVLQKLQPMISASEADELMIITAVYDHEARKKSYTLLADAFGLGKKAAA